MLGKARDVAAAYDADEQAFADIDATRKPSRRRGR
jgi:hypothetical protein